MAKRKVKNLQRAKIVALAAKIDVQKTIIANERDKLRELYSELEDICTSLDDGLGSIDEGLDTIQRGIDRMSEYI